jgi:hypothetical protein
VISSDRCDRVSSWSDSSLVASWSGGRLVDRLVRAPCHTTRVGPVRHRGAVRPPRRGSEPRSHGPTAAQGWSASTEHEKYSCNYRGFSSAPGVTRTPNLLIRRSPSGVPGGPRPSRYGSATGFRFHQRPQPSAAVHRDWLPTWLPASALPASWQDTDLCRDPHMTRNVRLGAQSAGYVAGAGEGRLISRVCVSTRRSTCHSFL